VVPVVGDQSSGRRVLRGQGVPFGVRADTAVPELAREYYAKEFLDYRRKKPTPYMQGLRFVPSSDTADRDERVLSDDDIRGAQQEGRSAA
jgi:hypothetical protein